MNDILRHGVYPEQRRRVSQNDISQEPLVSSEARNLYDTARDDSFGEK